MKTILPLLLLFAIQLTSIQQISGQEQANTRLFRIYEDNDFLNIRGKGTDDAYTNGTRFDMFYTKNHPSRFVIDRKMPKAGDSSVDVFGWSIMQVMFTPQDITKAAPQPNDYPWSGGLFATHSLYSYNPKKKYSFQTELLLGVMGPASFTRQVQTFVHHVIRYKEPAGWANQLGNDPLVNISFTAEKQFAHYNNWIEVIGGGQASYGTATNGLAVYPMVRIGKMAPYFNGYISQYSTASERKLTKHRGRRLQAYIILKPEAQLIFTDALLQGGLFASNTYWVKGIEVSTTPANGIRHAVYSANYGVVLSAGQWSMSFVQNSSTEWIKNTYSHEFGNISMYFSW